MFSVEGKHILLVEDEAIIALSQKNSLEKYGYKVTCVHNGNDAIKTVLDESLPVDLILMDIDLGAGMDGTQVAQRILQERDVPVVFLSSHTEPEVVEKTEKITSYGYVVKMAGIVVLDASIKMAFKLFEAKLKEREKEEALRDSEKQFRTLFEQSAVGVAQVSPDGSFLRVNARFSDIVGYSNEELTAMTFKDITHPEDVHLDEKEIAMVMRGETSSFDIEKRYINKNGNIHWIHLYSNVVRDNDGNVQYAIAVVVDITREHEYKEELKNTLEATTDGIWSWNFKTNELHFSSKYYTMLGCEPNEFPANFETWSALIHPEDLEKALAVAQEYLETKPDVYENIFRLKTKSGDYQWIRARAKVVRRDSNGEAEYMIGNHENITEQREYEKHILFLSSIAEQINESIIVTDNTFMITYINKAAERLFGYSREELIGKSPNILNSEPLAEKLQQQLYAAIEKGKSFEDVWTNVRKDGTTFSCELRVSPLFDQEGTVFGYMGIQRDVTGRL